MLHSIRSFLRREQAMAAADYVLVIAIIAAGAAAGLSVFWPE